ncbi:hypothetical protein WJX74_010483 [Apatococcus lobatus]|uniref:Uncharacterized protein n=1 Tax=Apatococcus lobatus TaxID=904363 RepID=A0AAW1RT73_9CHLO
MLADLAALQDKYAQVADKSNLQPTAVQVVTKHGRQATRQDTDCTHKPLRASQPHSAVPAARANGPASKRLRQLPQAARPEGRLSSVVPTTPLFTGHQLPHQSHTNPALHHAVRSRLASVGLPSSPSAGPSGLQALSSVAASSLTALDDEHAAVPRQEPAATGLDTSADAQLEPEPEGPEPDPVADGLRPRPLESLQASASSYLL